MNMLDNLRPYRVMLASASPRRRELLSQLLIDFEIATGKDVDESYPDDMPADEVAAYLSRQKADAYKADIAANELVITADTIVINNNTVLGKPATAQEAVEMLQSLSGHTHKVITGVTITSATRQVTFSAVTLVEFATLDDAEIHHYVDTFTPLDKAGAYGIQEWIGCIGVRNINGSYYNVMGLPLHRLYSELKNFKGTSTNSFQRQPDVIL